MAATNNNTNATVSTLNIAAQKATVEAEYKALIAGINTELASEANFIVSGTAYTKADLVARFQSRLDAAEKTKTNRTALHLSVADERDVARVVEPLRMGFKTYLQSRFGKTSQELQKFGFKPNKTPQRPVAAKAVGIAKTKATRKVRNTTGKKGRLKITAAPQATATATAAPAQSPAQPAAAKPASG